MNELHGYYIFQSLRHSHLILRKANYRKHIPFHPEIDGEEGRNAIQDVLLNPDIVTKYENAEVSYRILSKRNNFIGKPVIDYWKVIAVRGPRRHRWEIATAFIATSPEYAMINTRIETIIYKKHEKE